MRNAMYRYGAIDVNCPKCGKVTPAYPFSGYGGPSSTPCQYCNTGIQFKNGKPVERFTNWNNILEMEHLKRLHDREAMEVIEKIHSNPFKRFFKKLFS